MTKLKSLLIFQNTNMNQSMLGYSSYTIRRHSYIYIYIWVYCKFNELLYEIFEASFENNDLLGHENRMSWISKYSDCEILFYIIFDI